MSLGKTKLIVGLARRLRIDIKKNKEKGAIKMNDYKSRLRKELEDLNFKIEKLNNFIEKNDIFKTIDLEEQELLKEQREIMNKYANILRKRIK
ncbi:hypothetical protein J5A73_01895 [Leptotrichia sp. oral taxon 218]|uniref:crAss001_48 related protein n=1 Tax=Leptotrichia sp. oral taxon 218 TaxID=712361 RepID=UPI001B8B1FCB|nr:hypothetical protein [Leptotrichia sp. oral taxon 218]QUB95655.1 hypothetical protein J5A73_01895 [Leptotrichia sp. oral taxon 218]